MTTEEYSHEGESLKKVSGLYKDWFLDYASYVILDRAIPSVFDGLKPVQRRIMHSMRELEDGRYNKVANIVGNTMKYHPHGDASITDAMVQIGQKELLIDTQETGEISTPEILPLLQGILKQGLLLLRWKWSLILKQRIGQNLMTEEIMSRSIYPLNFLCFSLREWKELE